MRSSSTLFAALVVLTSAVSARAQTAEDHTSGQRDERGLTVMWAPLRLIIPIAELTGEYRIQDQMGVSVEVGAGHRTLTSGNTDIPGTEVEGGAQFRYYVLGSFTHGMELGAEALYEYVTFDEPLPNGIVAVAAGGLTLGPFVGYKIVTRIGFTFEAQLGARYLAADPPVTGQSGSTPTLAENDKWAPLLHLNVGWTF